MKRPPPVKNAGVGEGVYEETETLQVENENSGREVGKELFHRSDTKNLPKSVNLVKDRLPMSTFLL